VLHTSMTAVLCCTTSALVSVALCGWGLHKREGHCWMDGFILPSLGTLSRLVSLEGLSCLPRLLCQRPAVLPPLPLLTLDVGSRVLQVPSLPSTSTLPEHHLAPSQHPADPYLPPVP
jgi:hypothetical protein